MDAATPDGPEPRRRDQMNAGVDRGRPAEVGPHRSSRPTRGLDLRLLQYFLAVIDHGGVTKAAHALFVAQPSVSQALRNLERMVDTQLFALKGRKLELTSQGRLFEVASRRVLRDLSNAQAAVAAVQRGETGRLDIAALASLTVHPLPHLARQMRDRHQSVVMNVIDPGSALGVVTEVAQGRAEVGLTDLSVPTGRLRTMLLETHQFVVVLPAKMAASLPDQISVAQLRRLPLVLERTDAARAAGGSVISKLSLQPMVECVHREAIWALVRRGAGATILPRPVAESALADMVIREIRPALTQRVGLIYPAGHLSPAAAAFVAIAGAFTASIEAQPNQQRRYATQQPGPH